MFREISGLKSWDGKEFQANQEKKLPLEIVERKKDNVTVTLRDKSTSCFFLSLFGR